MGSGAGRPWRMKARGRKTASGLEQKRNPGRVQAIEYSSLPGSMSIWAAARAEFCPDGCFFSASIRSNLQDRTLYLQVLCGNIHAGGEKKKEGEACHPDPQRETFSAALENLAFLYYICGKRRLLHPAGRSDLLPGPCQRRCTAGEGRDSTGYPLCESGTGEWESGIPSPRAEARREDRNSRSTEKRRTAPGRSAAIFTRGGITFLQRRERTDGSGLPGPEHAVRHGDTQP